MCGTTCASCWEHVRVPSSAVGRSRPTTIDPPAGVKSGENRSIFPTFAQLDINGRREPDFFDKLTAPGFFPGLFLVVYPAENKGD